MDHSSTVMTDLLKLKEEVLNFPPEFSLPCNLSDEWLQKIAMDLEKVVCTQEDDESNEELSAAVPMALIFHILSGKFPGNAIHRTYEVLWEHYVDLRLEVNLEILNRRTDCKSDSATLETIFTKRDVYLSQSSHQERE